MATVLEVEPAERPSKQEARMIAREVKFVTDSLLEERRFELSVPL
jgi:hypothetical protein